MSPVNSLWFKWKSLRLPWRKSFLVGSDLTGNTYWEFKDALNAGRFRRIVKYNPKTHYADVQVTPQWHQWLRYVRPTPPSIEEQQQDVLRQLQMKQLARLADERWASKPSYLDKPQRQQPLPATSSDPTLKQPAQNPAQNTSSPETQKPVTEQKPAKDPWAKAQQAQGEGWQPEPWSPSTSQR
ncbi:hypothetical protein ASPWEDRAFT_33796 [Aspergillus wentii DTO 134E9]|uniref:Uncharacterized protein n=1 Tax=Aspergillus wentii DTO 134E9 TaxID=1073089 RepID=A0A1L9RZN9_ASPWE|nr:uncharacterized protein ASPWEDRAFT_33796 [Aspergillus wentii DTO 134E9]KAI9932829.1 hypothetical protein MW887_009081 [Aspergillus wentii]OJJ40411.1 hypothetical protein ASPWEDRAFT_33796 [Aspergillus wentii DTO 134E9]